MDKIENVVDEVVTYVEPEEDLVENFEDEDECSESLGPIAIAGTLLIGGLAAGGIWAWKKTKNKRLERKIKKLEKLGYTIVEPEEDEEVIEVEAKEVEEVNEKKEIPKKKKKKKK